VLLNRAPTLHRLGIQSFEPVLVEGRAIQIHPLVCTAYNADFDGDQMAVHVPLSAEAQAEARLLMLSTHNILNPKDGKPVTTPTQDMVIGCYYLTLEKPDDSNGEEKAFLSMDEAQMAYDNKYITLHQKIRVRTGPYEYLSTTVGRLIFNQVLPEGLRYVNKPVEKKELGSLISRCFDLYGSVETGKVLDGIKELGFHFATRAGITIAVTDIKVPEEKWDILAKAEEEVENIEQQHRRGLISEDERYQQTVDVWTKATDNVTESLKNSFDAFNPVYMMATSGARGNIQQIRQLAGMRGLMADPSGRIIDVPIKANFREGLTVLEYFTSTHGARKGLADTALRTADSGYLTRRLVDVAQDVIVREEDCGTTNGIMVNQIKDGSETIEGLADRIEGRTALDDIDSVAEVGIDEAVGKQSYGDVSHPETGEIICAEGEIISEEAIEKCTQLG
jgi:DNA-directed RNA polymerase subunit beta'